MKLVPSALLGLMLWPSAPEATGADTPPPVAFSTNRYYLDSSGKGQIELVLSQPSDTDIIAPVSVGSLYSTTLYGHTLIPAGATSQRVTIEFPILSEPLAIRLASGGAFSPVAEIVPATWPEQVNFRFGLPPIIPEGQHGVWLWVRRSGNMQKAIDLAFSTVDGTAKSGADFIATNGVLRFLPGVRELPIIVSILNDLAREEQEPFLSISRVKILRFGSSARVRS